MTKEIHDINTRALDFVVELIEYIFEYPDDDYMTMECLCRKLAKHRLLDKADGYYQTHDICTNTHECVKDTHDKTESDSEKPNNCEHITEDGVTCAKYPACDDCLDNPLNKVKGSERLLKGKDDPTISKMEQVDKDINVRSKDEPKWTKENCKGCKYNEYPYDSGTCFVRVCINGNKYEPKDEPQTDCLEQFRVGLEYHTDTTHFGKVKGESITTNKVEDEPQLTAKCLNCSNGGSYKCAKCDGEMYYKYDKDEPQTDGILFKGNLKEGDYKLIKTTNGWVLEGNDIAYYGEPQTERSK